MANTPTKKYPFRFVMTLTDRMGSALKRKAKQEDRPLLQVVRELIAESVGMGRK